MVGTDIVLDNSSACGRGGAGAGAGRKPLLEDR